MPEIRTVFIKCSLRKTKNWRPLKIIISTTLLLNIAITKNILLKNQVNIKRRNNNGTQVKNITL